MFLNLKLLKRKKTFFKTCFCPNLNQALKGAGRKNILYDICIAASFILYFKYFRLSELSMIFDLQWRELLRKGLNSALYYPTFRIPSLYYQTFRILSLYYPTFRIPSLYYPTFRIPSLYYPTFRIPSLYYPTFRIPSL